jgi:hypothetical protein
MKPGPRLSSRLWGTSEADSISATSFSGFRAQEKKSPAHAAQTIRSALHGRPEGPVKKFTVAQPFRACEKIT